MENEKSVLLKQLDDARDQLWQILDAIDPASKVTDEWNKRDFFAHLAGWDALVFDIFRDYLAGAPAKFRPYTNVDDANREFLKDRQSLTLEDTRLASEINRFAIKTQLQSIPAEDYHQSIQFPWGPETIVTFIEGAIKHELDHAEDIAKITG